MAAIDRDELHRLWTTSTLSLTALGAYFGVTKHALAGAIRTARKDEGEERWPPRPSPLRAAKPRYERKRAGPSTLPPLPSLQWRPRN